jgi:hypothetical protein
MADQEYMEELEALSTPSTEVLNDLTQAVRAAVNLEDEVDNLEAMLKARKEELEEVLKEKLPEMLAQAGVGKFRTLDGLEVDVRPFCMGGLPKEPEPRKKAFDWLEQNHAGPLIKVYVEAALEKGALEDPKVRQILKSISILFGGIGATMTQELNVHPMTLGAFIRERLAKGEEVPDDTLGVTVGRKARIVRTK